MLLMSAQPGALENDPEIRIHAAHLDRARVASGILWATATFRCRFAKVRGVIIVAGGWGWVVCLN